MLLWVALGRRLRPESLVFRRRVEVLIISGCLCVVGELIDTVLLSGFLDFKAFTHGVDAVIPPGLGWFRALAVSMAFLPAVEAFPSRVVLRAC